MRIVTEERSDDWIAYIDGHPELWEAGTTENDAIAKLYVSYPDILEEKIVVKNKWLPLLYLFIAEVVIRIIYMLITGIDQNNVLLVGEQSIVANIYALIVKAFFGFYFLFFVRAIGVIKFINE